MSQTEIKSRLLFHTINGHGLGHLSRQVALARAVRAICPTTDILFASESTYGPVMAPDFPFIILPSHRELRTEDWTKPGSHRLALTLQAMVEALLTVYQPGAVIHDTIIWVPLFEAVAHAGIKQATVLRYRKDLHDSLIAPSNPAWRSDLLILPYSPEEAASILTALPVNCPPTICVGHVARRPTLPLSEVRRRIGIRDDVYLIVLTAGGGGFKDTPKFYQQTLDALKIAVSQLTNYLIVLVLGPSYRSSPPTTNRLNIQVWHALPWMPDLIAASDLVICQAGYNTLAEVERAQVPAVVIPVEKELDDQFLRAREAAKLKQHIHIFEGSNYEDLANLIADIMRRPAMGKQGSIENTTLGGGLRTDELKQIAMLGQVDEDPKTTNEAPSMEIGRHL